MFSTIYRQWRQHDYNAATPQKRAEFKNVNKALRRNVDSKDYEQANSPPFFPLGLW